MKTFRIHFSTEDTDSAIDIDAENSEEATKLARRRLLSTTTTTTLIIRKVKLVRVVHGV